MQKEYAQVLAQTIFPIMQNTSEESTCSIAQEFWSIFAREEHGI